MKTATAAAILLVPTLVAADEASSDWWTRASEEIRRSEYRISLQEESVRRGEPGGLHAANRAGDLRAYFRGDGIEWMQRTERDPSWTLRLSLRDNPVDPEHEGHRVTYRRDGLVDWRQRDYRWRSARAGPERGDHEHNGGDSKRHVDQ